MLEVEKICLRHRSRVDGTESHTATNADHKNSSQIIASLMDFNLEIYALSLASLALCSLHVVC